MRMNIFSILSVATASLFVSCGLSCTKVKDDSRQEEVVDITPVDPQPKPTGPQPGTYTFVASSLKGKWEEGDKIYVHGAYGPAAQMVTLSASDISSDGRTASVRLDAVTEYPAQPDGLYAAWPGEAVIEEEGITEGTTGFNRTDGLLSVAYLTDDRFEFVDASSGLSFSVSGYSRFVLAGNQRPGLRFTDYEVEFTSLIESFYNRKNDGYPFLEGTVTEGKVLLWFPGNLTLKEGVTLYFGNDGTWPFSYVQAGDIKLTAGKIVDLGDITSALVPYDGPEPRMPEIGKRTKYAVQFNELSGLCLSEDGSFLWGLGDGSEIARLSFEGEVLEKASLKTTGGSSIDSEAISLNYDTGDLLIGGEPASVCNIPKDKVGGIFSASTFKGVDALFKIDDAKGFSNAGLEGLTYYKDGLAYAGTQTGSYLYLCDLATGEVKWRKDLRTIFPAITEIADLCYDPLTDWLWIIDSESRYFFALTGDAETLLGSYSTFQKGKIENPESICVDHAHSCIWVGDDYGSTSYLYRFEFTGLDEAIIPAE